MTEGARVGGPGGGALARVVLVDDHGLFRAGVAHELAGSVNLVGEAGDVPKAVVVIHATRPDVVLLDVHLPGGGGRAVLDACVPELPDTRFLALSVSDAADDVIGVVRVDLHHLHMLGCKTGIVKRGD